MTIIHLERVESRYILDLQFKLESPLHIGSRTEGLTKLMLQFPVRGRSIPIIPGESLKGVLRSLASAISRSVFPNDDVILCHEKDSHVRRENLNNLKNKYYNIAEAELSKIFPRESIEELKQGDGAQLLEYYLTLKCPICKLFGGKGVSGKILISDGLPQKEPDPMIYTSVAIDRRTRIAAEGRLFQVVAVKPDENLRYRFRIIVDNVTRGSEEARLLSLLLEFLMKFGISVGGLKSRGYGKLAVDKDISEVIILKLREVEKGGDPLSNIRALLLKDGYYDKMKLEEFIGWLR